MGPIGRLVFVGVSSVVMLVLLLLPLKSRAYGVVPSDYTFQTYQVTVNATSSQAVSYQGYIVGKRGELCGLVGAKFSAGHAVFDDCYVTGTGSQGGEVKYRGLYGVNQSIPFTLIGLACPTDSTVDGTSACVCNAGFQPNGSTCKATNCTAVAESLAGASLEWSGSGATTCYKGCELGTSIRGYSSATNKTSTSGQYVSATGEACAGDKVTGTTPGTGEPPLKCPAAQCPGTVNGTAVCVPCSSTTIPGPSSSASGAGTGGGTGGETTKTDTTCVGDKCTTTKITKDGTGAVTGTVTTEESKESFCSQNAELAICKDGKFGGECLGGFTCEGDALQCAMAQEQHKRACQFFEVDPLLAATGEEAANGEATPDGHPRAAGQTSSFALASLLDQSARLSGSCPQDTTFSVGGQTVVFGISKVCAPAALAGQAAVAVSLFIALFIVFRR